MANILIKSTSELKNIILSELKDGTVLSVTIDEGGDSNAEESENE